MRFINKICNHLLLISLLLSSGPLQAQDSAKVFFYRPLRLQENSVILLLEGDAVLGKVFPGGILTRKFAAGKHTITMSIVNNTEFSLEAQDGQVYFVETTMDANYFKEAPAATMKTPYLARMDIEKLNPALAQTIELDKTEELIRLRTDTIRAVEKLFSRKSINAGRGCLYFGFGLAGSLIYLAQGEGADPGTLALDGVFLYALIKNINKADRYDYVRFSELRKAYREGTPLPTAVKLKLRPKDFRRGRRSDLTL